LSIALSVMNGQAETSGSNGLEAVQSDRCSTVSSLMLLGEQALAVRCIYNYADLEMRMWNLSS
jgi:hypothetical protein